ncbi:hypothetical protein [Companilactobacillus halodurans]|uniref:YfhO family protein n=1 Tax=Companilactobacillus halodurans TaxID=2584183 RepID=A0A5P0ZTB6_9LACO|nr:hypothetical protein [Companilactobacillus halodurans]MQS75582.1 hypothetical protein [Companilactobacillus halodurans]MQS96296.1 hypothetical protein [Companilactobacillus halodurans]
MREKAKYLLTKFAQKVSPATLAIILIILTSSSLLFVWPIHGLADNGNFYRAIAGNGIYRLPTSYSQYSDYVVPKFGLLQYFNENKVQLFSSQNLFIQLAILLNKIFYSHTIFDIRFLGFVYYVFYLGGIYLFTNSLTAPTRKFKNYLMAIFIVFAFGDSAFTLYFNSFFAEPGMLILMLYLCAAIISLARNIYVHHWPMITLFFIASILLVTMGSQNAILAISLAIMGLGIMFLPNFKTRRLAAGFGIVLILLSGIGIYKTASSEVFAANDYQTFTHGILDENSDPTKKIEKNGIDGQFALMRNEPYYPKDYTALNPNSEDVKKNLIKKSNLSWVIKYYATHLKQMGDLLNVAAKDLTAIQPESVGNYPIDSGHEAKEQVTYFTFYSTFFSALFPSRYTFNCLIAVGLIAAFSVGFYKDFRAKRYQGILRLFLIIGLMTIVVIAPIFAILIDGDADLSRRLFMIPISLNIALLIFINDVFNHTLWNTEVGDGVVSE